MKNQTNAYLDQRERIFNFLGSIAEGYPESSDEHNILRLACHAILFCHTIEAKKNFRTFLTNSPKSEAEKAFYDKIGP